MGSAGWPGGRRSVRPLAVDRSTQFGRALEATVVGPRVFFAGALPFTSEQVLCVSDGTHEGSRELGRFDEATRPFALGNTALFGTRTGSASELWRSDGTLAGTVRVTTLPTLPLQPRQVGGVVMMLVGASLWQTDGTPGGTGPVPGFVQVAQIEPLADGIALLRSGMLDLYRPSSGSVSLLAPSGVTRLVGQVAGHLAYERNSNLFSVDHVGQTHPLVAAGFAGASASVGRRLLFTVGMMGGVSLWSSDGVSAIQLAAVPSLPLRSSARLQSVSNDRALFDVFPGGGSPRSWVTDGTAAGTQELPYAGNVLLLASRPGRMLGVVAALVLPLSSGCGSELRAVGTPRVGARAITLRARTQLGPAVALLGAGSGSTPIDFSGQTCDLRVTDLIAALPTRMRADVSELDLLMPGHPGAVGATLTVQFLYAKALGGAAQLVLGR